MVALSPPTTLQTTPLDYKQMQEEITQFTLYPQRLATVPLQEIIKTLSALQKRLLQRSDPLHALYKDKGLPFLLQFLSSESLEASVTLCLRHSEALEAPVDIAGITCLATPLGVVGHWLAGNTPLLSLVSIIQALLTKNLSLVKISSRQEDIATPFLQALGATGAVGSLLKDAVKVYRFSGADRQANELFSLACDMRLAWGGREAVEAIQSLPTKSLATRTLMMGPKTSLAVIDGNLMTPDHYLSLARDCLLFHQLACTSPHALIIKGTFEEVRTCGHHLAAALEQLGDHPLFGTMAPYEASAVVNYRTERWMEGHELITASGTAWTLHLHRDLAPLQSQGFCLFHLYPFDDAQDLLPYLPATLQTVAHCLSPHDLKRLITTWRGKGACRYPRLGHAHHYALPWDGLMTLEHLVHWTYIEGSLL